MRKHQTSPDQLVLPGFESDALPALKPRQRAPFNLFFAIKPEPETAASIAERTGSLIQMLCVDAKSQATERLHVSLHNLRGHWAFPHEIVDGAKRAASEIKFPSFEIAFARVSSFGGGAVVLHKGTNPELFIFHRMLGSVLQNRGLLSLRSFTPHMTIAYQKTKVADLEIEQIRWTAERFFLIWSLVGKGIYEVLGEWRLTI